MKRVLALYRVSTLKQVDKDDIPMQKIECRRFAQDKGWDVVKEYSEKGISGYKILTDKRDAIQEIRSEAERKTFDILLVFMFDRLGRREDEIPFLVEWFISHGIEVWSAKEGQQKIENRTDKLMNYIRYWQAGGESEKTSERVKTKHKQMIEEGIFRGGRAPFGYNLVHNGRTGRKNRPLYDLEINPDDAKIVVEMFDLSCWHGYGCVRMANYLNEKYPNIKKWNPRSVMMLLQNSTYIGVLHCGETQSPVQDNLRIIDEATYEYAQKVIRRRINIRGNSESQTITDLYSGKLLSGLLYCSSCGHRLVGNYTKLTRSNKTTYRPIYRCYYGATHKGECEGKHTYTAGKVDDIVIELVHAYFNDFNATTNEIWMEQYLNQVEHKELQDIKTKRSKLSNIEEQNKKIKKEILKSLMGDSSFDQDTLKSLLSDNQELSKTLEEEIRVMETSLSKKKEHANNLARYYKNVNDWSLTFDHRTVDEKKMILSQIIKKITIESNYNMKVEFYFARNKFIEKNAQSEDSLKLTADE